jgi:hypothetical protein
MNRSISPYGMCTLCSGGQILRLMRKGTVYTPVSAPLIWVQTSWTAGGPLTNFMVQGIPWKAKILSVKKFRPYMEPESSLSCSQKPATGPHPKPVVSSALTTSHFSASYFNFIILPSMSRSLECSLSLRFPGWDFACIYNISIRATCPANLTVLDILTIIIEGYIWLRRYLTNQLLSQQQESYLVVKLPKNSLTVELFCTQFHSLLLEHTF